MFLSKPHFFNPHGKTSFYFWLFIILHALLWTLGPALLRTSVSHDTLEGITWGMQWQLGYNKHPFLTAWLCAGISQIFGVVGWPVYLLAQLAVLLTFYATWKLALEMLPSGTALIATLGLEGVLFYNINSFNLTPDTLQSPLWALIILFFYRAIKRQHVSSWLGVGFCAALSFCTKYQAVLLFASMLLFCVINPLARSSFKRMGIYCALGLFFLLISPHLLWLAQHHFITLRYAVGTASEFTHQNFDHIVYPLRFLLNNSLNVLGLYILFWPFIWNKPERRPVWPASTYLFEWHFLLFVGLGPVLLTWLLCIIFGSNFTPRWSTPYYSTLGILLMKYLQPKLSEIRIKQFAFSLVFLSTVLFTVRMSSFAFYSRPESDAFLPNPQIAKYLSTLWHDRYGSSLPFLAGSNYLVSTVTPYMPDKPMPYLSWKHSASAWISEQELRKKGALFIWDAGGNYIWDNNSKITTLPKKVMKRFPNLQLLPESVFYRTSDKKPVVIGVAILPPSL